MLALLEVHIADTAGTVLKVAVVPTPMIFFVYESVKLFVEAATASSAASTAQAS